MREPERSYYVAKRPRRDLNPQAALIRKAAHALIFRDFYEASREVGTVLTAPLVPRRAASFRLFEVLSCHQRDTTYRLEPLYCPYCGHEECAHDWQRPDGSVLPLPMLYCELCGGYLGMPSPYCPHWVPTRHAARWAS
jgi:hypothetical protein